MWNLERRLMNLFAGSSGDADIEKRLVDTVGQREGGMNSESSMEAYALPCVKQIAGGKSLYDTGIWVGWGGGGGRLRREGTCVHL